MRLYQECQEYYHIDRKKYEIWEKRATFSMFPFHFGFILPYWGFKRIFRLLQPVNSKQKFISLKRVRNKFLRAAQRDWPAIDRLAETKSCPVKPQKGKKYLIGKYFPFK